MKKMIIISLVTFLVAVSANTVMAGVVKTAPVTVNATVALGTNSLEVKNKAGTVLNDTTNPFSIPAFPAATSTTYRFSTGINSGTYTAPGQLAVNFFPAAPYEIRVYTNHSVPAGQPVVGYLLNGANKLPLKVWCQNFGAPGAPVTTGPDPMNAYIWGGYDFNGDGDKEDTVAAGVTKSEATYGDLNGDGDTLDTIESTGPDGGYVNANKYALGEEPIWLWMLEKGTMVEGLDGAKEYTRRRLSYNWGWVKTATPPAAGFVDADLGSPFNVFLAMDLMGIAAGSYTGAVTFEMYTY